MFWRKASRSWHDFGTQKYCQFFTLWRNQGMTESDLAQRLVHLQAACSFCPRVWQGAVSQRRSQNVQRKQTRNSRSSSEEKTVISQERWYFILSRIKRLTDENEKFVVYEPFSVFLFFRDSLAFATEPVFASLANVLGNHDNLPNPVPSEVKDHELYDVEIKYGFLQVREKTSSPITPSISTKGFLFELKVFWGKCWFDWIRSLVSIVRSLKVWHSCTMMWNFCTTIFARIPLYSTRMELGRLLALISAYETQTQLTRR